MIANIFKVCSEHSLMSTTIKTQHYDQYGKQQDITRQSTKH